MFSGARHLITYVTLTAALGPVVAVQAQSGTQGAGGGQQQAAGVTWLLPGMPGNPESLMSICEPPPRPVKKAIRPKKSSVKPAAPRLTLTPSATKPKPKRKVAQNVKIPPQPRMICPQVQVGPTMMGALDVGESVIPMPGEFPVEFEEMALVAPRELPLGEISPVTTEEGRRRIAPLIWLFGGGAGVALFSQFSDGDDPGRRGTPLLPIPPTPPTIDIPEIPPVTTTPEPGTIVLVGTGLVGVAGAWRRRRQQGNKTEE